VLPVFIITVLFNIAKIILFREGFVTKVGIGCLPADLSADRQITQKPKKMFVTDYKNEHE
jgi:hypothetical protein